MEEIKLLVEAVAKLPNAALWVLLGYLVYKLAVVGSIYGVIKFAVDKLHAAYIIKHQPRPIIYAWRDGIDPINQEVKDSIIDSLLRLKNCPSIHSTKYVHDNYADTLAKIVNDYINNGQAKK